MSSAATKIMIIIMFCFFASVSIELTSGFVTPIRSIKHCSESSRASSLQQCQSWCQTQFSYLDQRRETRRKIIGQLMATSSADGNIQKCCCIYDDFWQIQPQDQWITKFGERLQIKPLKSFQLPFENYSKNIKAYNTMCKYLYYNNPLTMLELKIFIDLVIQVREAFSSNPIISRKLNHRLVPTFHANSSQVFKSLVDKLYDQKRTLDQPKGPPFEVDQIEQIQEVTEILRYTFQSNLVDRALDELIISRVMINILEAKKMYVEINASIPDETFELLTGFGRTRNPKHFMVENFNCEKFSSDRDVLKTLLNASKRALGTLRVQFAYNTMSFEWEPMKKLQKSILVYDKLIFAYCNRSNT